MSAFLLLNVVDYLWLNIAQMNGNIFVEQFFSDLNNFFFLQKAGGKKQQQNIDNRP